MNKALCPRSILFAPSDRPDIATKALHSQADAVCLDLEDAVALPNKPQARNELTDLVEQANQQGKAVWIRINSDMLNAALDLTTLPEGVAMLVIPKTQGWSQLQWIHEALKSRFNEAARPGLVAMFEDVVAIEHFLNTPASPEVRLSALALGTEDLSSNIGVKPNRALLSRVFYDLVKLGQKLNAPVLGFPDSIAIIQNSDLLEKSVEMARQLGASGAFCIHPKQLPSINQGFMPGEDEIRWAEATLTLETKIKTEGVALHPLTGQMIDAPVLEQARRVLAHE